MVQLDIPGAFVASMFFVDLGKKILRREAEKSDSKKTGAYYRFLSRSILFAGLVICPAGIYLLAGWPGWENIYWYRRFEELILRGWINALLPTAFLMSIIISGYIGFRLGYRLVIKGKEKYLRTIYIGVLLLSFVPVLLSYPSFLLVGTYDEYHNVTGLMRDTMPKVWDNPYGFGVGWLGVMIYFVIMLLIVSARIRREVKKYAM